MRSARARVRRVITRAGGNTRDKDHVVQRADPVVPLRFTPAITSEASATTTTTTTTTTITTTVRSTFPRRDLAVNRNSWLAVSVRSNPGRPSSAVKLATDELASSTVPLRADDDTNGAEKRERVADRYDVAKRTRAFTCSPCCGIVCELEHVQIDINSTEIPSAKHRQPARLFLLCWRNWERCHRYQIGQQHSLWRTGLRILPL